METVALRKREVAREQLAQEIQRLAVRICQERLARIGPLVVFSEADYQAQLDDITKKEESAKKLLASREAESQQWETVKRPDGSTYVVPKNPGDKSLR